MKKEKIELLKTYANSNVAPVIIDFMDDISISNSVVLPANCELSELNGYYENLEYVPPKWFNKLSEFNDTCALIIDKIDSIPKNEQAKFIEILKYKKVSTFELPKNAAIIVTASKINKDVINDEVYSLVAHISE